MADGRVSVMRIVPDFGMDRPEEAKAFYREVFDLEVVMDQGWIVTFAGEATTSAQISVMSEGGSGAPVPDVSIEVDDVDAVHDRARARAAEIVYALTDEPCGVRRFFLRDPAGKILNVLAHRRS